MERIRVYEFGGPEVLKLEDAPDPDPLTNEVVIQVKAAGVNPYDTYMRAGAYGSRNPDLPYTPGSDAAGVVWALGSEVKSISVGDRVYTTGTISGAYAGMAVCNRSQLHPLPPSASFSQGAALFVPYATAYRSLFQLAHAKAGETVLIHGASGGVGIAAVQWARAAGLTVIGTAGSEKGLELIRAQGAHHAVNHLSTEHHPEIMEITKAKGVDVILEMLANKNLGVDLKLLAERGRVVVIGSRGEVQIDPRDVMVRGATIKGMLLWATPESDLEVIFEAIDSGLKTGILRPVIGLELPLAAASEAHRRVMEPGALGKIVLLPGSDQNS